MTRPNPVRTPDGYASKAGGAGGGEPVNLAVAFYTGYDAASDAPISLGSRVASDVAGGTFDVSVAGFGFAVGDTVELVVNQPGPPPTTPATLGGAVITDPVGSTPGSITATINLAVAPAESVGQYALVVTNSDGNRGLANVQINPAA